MNILKEIEKWSKQYDLSFQFWGPRKNNVFITKANVDITSFGGEDTPEEIIKAAIEWCEKNNPKGVIDEKSINRCESCGVRIAPGNDFCGECLCEDDCDY